MAFVKTVPDDLAAARANGHDVSIAALCALMALVIPWINPFAVGPTPNVLPWLVSLVCVAWLVLIVKAHPVPLARLVGTAWLLAALLNSGAGLLQFLGFGPSLTPWINMTELGEAFGNLRQRNQFATLANIGVAVLLWQAPAFPWNAAAHKRPMDDGVRSALWSLAAMALLAVGNAASASRTGLLQLVMLVVVVLVSGGWRSRRMRMLLTTGLVVYVAASALLPLLVGQQPFGSGAVSRFNADGMPCGSRIALWSNVLHLIGMKPWSGWGWGELDYAHFMTPYPGIRFCNILDNAHNLPLQLAVELGIPAALLICGLITWLVVRARPWRETQGERQTAWAALALIGLHSLLEYPLWYGPFQIAVGLAVWILWSTPAPDFGLARERPTGNGHMPIVTAPLATHVLRAAAAVLMVVVAYAAWDYRRISQIYRTPELRAAAYRDGTLAKIQGSWLFANQVRFAALTLTTVNPGNAQTIYNTAQALLHFSPEARVVEKVIDSALLLGHDREAADFMLRYRNAYPLDYARWKKNRLQATAPPSIDE